VKAFRGLTKKVAKGQGGFTLIELLIVIIILGILAAVVAFNVAGFLGAGTEESAKTERSAVQTAIIAGMADVSCGQLDSSGTIDGDDQTMTLTCAATNATTFDLEDYMHLPTHGNWTWDVSGVVTSGTYSGGGKICTYAANATPQWNCTAG
jgi:prepilin-type N-terminal cleavage/methylation domain-containing protein